MKQFNLKYCIGFLKEKALIYIVTLLADKMLVSVCYNIVLAFIMKNIVNGIAYKNEENFKQAFLIAAVSFLIAFIFQPIVNKIFNYSIRTTLGDVRIKLFKHMMILKTSEFEKLTSGEILSRITNDVDKLEEIYKDNIPNFTFAVMHGVIAITAMFMENMILAAIAAGFGLFSVIVNNIVSKKIEKYSSEYQRQTEILNQQIIDLEDGFGDIKTNEAEKAFYGRISLISDNIRNLYYKKENQMSKTSVLSGAFYYINLLGVMFIGIFMAINNKITIGSVMAIIHLQGNADYLFSTFSTFLAGIRKNLPSCERIVKFLHIETETKFSECIDVINDNQFDYQIDKKPDNHILSIKDLSYSYDNQNKKIIDKFSMNIEKNGLTVIVGESGCGKSTLMKILIKLYEFNHGDICIHGKSIHEIETKAWREKISYVPQDSYLFQMSILDNIRLGNNSANIDSIEHAIKLAGAHDFIAGLENRLDTIVQENSANLSGGQKQRIALARAFLKDSEIMIIDEGTKALDCQLEEKIIDNLKDISKDKAVIVVSHRQSILEKADSIYNMGYCNGV